MGNQRQNNLKLQEVLISGAMPRGRAWKCLGIHVKAELEAEDVEIPENAIDCRTVVKSFDNGDIEVGAEWNNGKKPKFDVYDEGRGQYMQIVGIVSSPEELRHKFPQLFELDGGTYPFA